MSGNIKRVRLYVETAKTYNSKAFQAIFSTFLVNWKLMRPFGVRRKRVSLTFELIFNF